MACLPIGGGLSALEHLPRADPFVAPTTPSSTSPRSMSSLIYDPKKSFVLRKKSSTDREEERNLLMTEEMCFDPLDPLRDGLSGTFLDDGLSLTAESLFPEGVSAEILQGLVRTEFVTHRFEGEVTYDKNHIEIYKAVRQNQKAMQNDAFSKLAYELYDCACKEIIYSLTNVRVPVTVDGVEVSATCVATSFLP
jgi:hypothetical protein